MKYRLKDKELQRKLDDITKGGFSKVLEKGIPPTFFYEEFLILGAGSIRVHLFESAFEEVPQYDPHAWNEWPDITPPEGVLLRIEVKGPDENLNSPEPRFGKVRERCCAKFDGQYWVRSNGLIVLLHGGETVRFRPWDDPREKENKE